MVSVGLTVFLHFVSIHFWLTALLVTTASVSGFLDSRTSHGVSFETTLLRYLVGGLIAALIVMSAILIGSL